MIKMDEIIGIFDMETSTISKITRDYLTQAEKGRAGGQCLHGIAEDLHSLSGYQSKSGKTVYISQISSSTLLKRSRFIENISNVNMSQEDLD